MLQGFAPVAGEAPRVLILGTMPSVASLGKTQYYGHPRNAFWPIQFALAGQPLSEDYARRCDLLRQRGIALWDVVGACEREGSLDADIRRPQPNAIGPFLKEHPEIRAILFNGKGAQRLFRQLVLPGLDWSGEYRVMPSTSPAYTLSWEKKLAAWRQLGAFLDI